MKVEQSVLGLKAHIKVNKYIRTTGISASVLLFALSILSTFPITSRDNSAEATANPSTTTLEITSSSNLANVKLDVNSTSGNFASSNSPVAFSVITDNITGYSLFISGSDTSGKLVNETISTASLDSITSPLSRDSFAYGSSASAYNGKWGIKPSKYLSAANDNYLPAPTTDSILMDTTSAPNATANEYTIGLGARADFSTPAGTYSNTFVVQAVGRPVMYAINYLDTTDDDTVADLPETDSSSTSTAINFVLDPNSPTREGYTFIGWCDGTVNHANTPSTCDGTTYMPSATYIFEDPSASTTNIANFYAMWQGAGPTITFRTVNAAAIEFNGTKYTDGQTTTVEEGTYPIRGYYDSRYAFQSWDATAGTISNADYVDYNLNTYEVVGNATITLTGQYVETAVQNLDLTSCTSTPMPTYDTRDGQVYWVKKLDDGNCWMMDNLNLGAIDLTTDLTSSNTNISETVTADTFNSWRKDKSSYTRTASEFLTLTAENTEDGKDVDQHTGTVYGTLYNYCAISAGTVCESNYTEDDIYDICPAGWRLPTGGHYKGSEFNHLYSNPSYDSPEKQIAPVSEGGAAFTLSGYFYDNMPIGQGRFGSHASSTTAYGDAVYGWKVYPNLKPDITDGRYYGCNRGGGESIRCVRAKEPEPAVYLQDVDRTMIARMSEGETITLKDKRDDEEYKLAKLKDGNLWMLDNLRLDPTAVSLDVLKGNTNASDEVLTYYKNGGGSSPNPANGVSSNWTSASQDSYNLPYINTDYKDTVADVAYGEGSGKVGVYYNYCAASAGSHCYDIDTGSKNAIYSICPSDWKLPSGGDSGDFKKLRNFYSNDEDFITAFSVPLAGMFNSGSAGYQFTYVGFWASTYYRTYASRPNEMDVLSVSGTSVNFISNNRFRGYSMRCYFNKNA